MSSKAFAASDAEWAYHGGELVKVGDIRLSPATHALNYGTGVFEGIRAYWSEQRGTLQVLKMRALPALREVLPTATYRVAHYGRGALRSHAGDPQSQCPARGYLRPSPGLQGCRVRRGEPE